MLDSRLEPLLMAFVEATQRGGEGGRRTFIVTSTHDDTDARACILHDGLQNFRAHEEDIRELAAQGMVRLGQTSQGNLSFHVSSGGFTYYEALRGAART